ncbi:MAG: pyridoxal-phosphate dependent enzyme [Steroidobacteraceae bacterium]
MTRAPGIADVRAAAGRIAPWVHRTPVITSRTLDGRAGASLYFKCENLQRVGAFKARGAANAVLGLDDASRARGVVTHSSGNHAAALALAARNAGVRAWIVMPRNAPTPKVESVRRLGGEIVFCEPTLEAREAACAEVGRSTGATLVHPYDDAAVIAGQGTAALELHDDVPGLDALVVPVGGGGLLAGTSIVGVAAGIRTFGTEPAAVDDAARSLATGVRQPPTGGHTIADGLRTALGALPFEIARRNVADIVTVSEQEIVAAMRLVWEVTKLVIEPSSAVPVAALLERRLPLEGRRVGVILSGGNVDLDALPWAVAG